MTRSVTDVQKQRRLVVAIAPLMLDQGFFRAHCSSCVRKNAEHFIHFRWWCGVFFCLVREIILVRFFYGCADILDQICRPQRVTRNSFLFQKRASSSSTRRRPQLLRLPERTACNLYRKLYSVNRTFPNTWKSKKSKKCLNIFTSKTWFWFFVPQNYTQKIDLILPLFKVF